MSEELKEPYIKITLSQIYQEVVAQGKVVKDLTEEVKKQNHLRRDLDTALTRVTTLEDCIQLADGVGSGKKIVESGILRWAAFLFGLSGWAVTVLTIIKLAAK